MNNPLLRRGGVVEGGYLLSLNTLVSSALGFAFWLIVARRFAVADVGFAAAAVPAVTTVAGIGVVGLSSAFLRYVPRAGRDWGAVVVRGYAATGVANLVLATMFVLLIGRLDDRLGRLGALHWALLYVCGVLAWAISSLQDVVLIALRRLGLVLAENTVLAIVRIALLFVPGIGHGAHGIFVAWLAPTIGVGLVISTILARAAARSAGWRPLFTRTAATAGMVRYCAVGAVGSTATVLIATAMPVVVASYLGVKVNARFFLPWTIASSLQVVSTSMAAPLAAEIARGLADERRTVTRVLRHTVWSVALIGLPLLVVLPPAMRLLGPSYHVARVLFALLLAATIVNTVTAVFLARARAKGDVRGPALAQWSAALILVGGSAVLLPRIGLDGVGWSALAAQVVSAAIALSLDPEDELPRLDAHGLAGTPDY